MMLGWAGCMMLRRTGKCEVCEIPCSEKRDFQGPVDMFNPEAKPALKGDMAEDIKSWRNEPMYCEEHKK